MHEREKETASIDQLAAGINADGARLASLVDERLRGARSMNLFARSTDLAASDEAGEEPQPNPERDEEIAHEMAEHATVIRSASAELQRLANEMRATAGRW